MHGCAITRHRKCEWKPGTRQNPTRRSHLSCAAGRKVDPPFPFPPRGKPGRAGSPPRRQKRAAPPTRGQAPLCDPPVAIEDFS
jgi:hypothetical protein